MTNVTTRFVVVTIPPALRRARGSFPAKSSLSTACMYVYICVHRVSFFTMRRSVGREGAVLRTGREICLGRGKIVARTTQKKTKRDPSTEGRGWFKQTCGVAGYVLSYLRSRQAT